MRRFSRCWTAPALALLFAVPLVAQRVPQISAGEQLDTLTLLDALTAAVERDPALAVARAAADAAGAGREHAQAARFPQLAASGSLIRFEELMVVSPLHGFDPTDPPEFDRTLSQGRLSLRWTLLDGGARQARVSATSARIRSSEAGLSATEMDAVLEPLEAYLGVLGARDALAAQRTREQEQDSRSGS